MKLLTDLFPHQEEAYKKLKGIRVGALFMEQGTGKTRTALSLVKARLDAGKVNAILWLCPCSVKGNLKEDIIVHCGDMPDEIIVKGIESLSSSDRLFLLLLQLVEKYRVFLIVDETSLTKNPHAIRTERITALAGKCPYRLILNGTPISRNEADLFSHFFILDWTTLGYRSDYSFAANHLEYKTIKLPNGGTYTDRSRIDRVLNVDYLTEKIAPYTYQVRKSECLKLPEKKYERIPFLMTDEQASEYVDVEYEFLEKVDEMKAETIYKLFTACQNVTSGRHVLSKADERMKTAPMFSDPTGNPRIRELLALVERLGKEKAIIFCKYQHEVDAILQLLPGAVEFTGRVKQEDRQQNRQLFKDSAQFLVANKTCGAFGLNMQFCHNVIFYDNDFNLATRLQAEDRVHRMGQTQDVNIYDLECLNSIDVFILDCLTRKENMAEAFKRMVKEKGEEWKRFTNQKTYTKPSKNG